jgi:hypothetical protein
MASDQAEAMIYHDIARDLDETLAAGSADCCGECRPDLMVSG